MSKSVVLNGVGLKHLPVPGDILADWKKEIAGQSIGTTEVIEAIAAEPEDANTIDSEGAENECRCRRN